MRSNIFFTFFTIIVLTFSMNLRANEVLTNNWSTLNNFKISVDSSGFILPTTMAFIPNNDNKPTSPNYYVLELGGNLKVVLNNGDVLDYFTNFIPNKNPETMDQSGAAGICLDHETASIFVTYAYDDIDTGEKRNAFIKFNHNNNEFGIKPDDKQVFERLFLNEKSHSAHQIGPCVIDGEFIYIAVGYGLDKSEAQNINSTLGSLIRLNKNSLKAPKDNPFYIDDDKSTAQDFIWAYGFRNIFGLLKVQDSIYFTQNGGNIDSFGLIEKGKNYLWDGTDNGIAANSEYVFTPSQGLVSLIYVDKDTDLPKEFLNKFYIVSTGATGEYGPGDKGKSVWILDYDIVNKKVTSPPKEFIKFTGENLQLPVEIDFKDNSFYFFGIMPENNDYSTNIYKVSYEKNFTHSNLIDEFYLNINKKEDLIETESISTIDYYINNLRYRHLILIFLISTIFGTILFIIYKFIKKKK